MTRTVVVTDRATAQIQASYEWWAQNRSKDQADRWYNALAEEVEKLAETAEHHARAKESDFLSYEVRELPFGIGSRPTHRVIYTIRDHLVFVLAIRHAAQGDLHAEDLGL